MREELLLITGPTLYRLMALRDALVALKGPLADNPTLCKSLHKRLFDDEDHESATQKLRAVEPASLG